MRKLSVLLIILSILLISCGTGPADLYFYQPPEQVDDGLEVGTLAEVSIDAALIEKAVSRILSGIYSEVHSLLVIRDNKLVLEEYFSGHRYQWDGPGHHGYLVDWNRQRPHNVMSVGKSYTSACIGIAIDQGFIEGVHQSIFDYLPDHGHLNTGGKDAITIEHPLTMTSGIQWKEWGTSYTETANDMFKLWTECDDQVACTLEKPLAHAPGTHFTYSGGGMVLLGAIVKNATGLDIEAFAAQYLFEPMGIDPPEWVRFESGVADASGGLMITPRDMAKFGLTFLNRGLWKDRRIISEGWVDNSATTYPGNEGINVPGEASGRVGYSYTWWTKQLRHGGKRINMFYAGGWGGQLIIVLPELETVVVLTGGNYTTGRPDFKILEKYVLAAIDGK